MGTWGIAISSNDTYADVYNEFFDLYNEGIKVDEISNKLIEANHETINERSESNNFWFALAKAQWECKELDEKVFKRVKEIIESEMDLKIWRELDAQSKDIYKRKLVLEKFLTKIEIERPKAKSRKKKKIKQPVFEKGACLTFKLDNGNYGGAIVLEAIKDSEYGHNLIVATRINQQNKPTKSDFASSEVLIINYGNWIDKEIVNWYLPIRHKQIANLIDIVDKIEIQTEYYYDSSMYGNVADFDIWIIDVIQQQMYSEKSRARPTKTKSIKEFIGKNK